MQPEPPDRPVLAYLTTVGMAQRQPDGGVTATAASGGGECFLFGPHWCLSSGAYRLSFMSEIGDSQQSRQALLGVEVIAQNRFRRNWQDFTAAELRLGQNSIEFSVPPEMGVVVGQEARFEFKFFHFGDNTVKLHAVTLTRLGDHADHPLPKPVWRLLSRLRKSWAAHRHADGNVTGRGPLGRFMLDGAWPYLRLASGRYRLTVRGEAHADDAAPLLEIRVLARSHWRRRPLRRLLGYGIWRPDLAELSAARTFQAADLKGAAVEFTVPNRLGIESGEDAPMEFQFYRPGFAGLTISDVTLEQLEAGAAIREPSVSASHALAPRRKRVVIIGNCQADIICNGFQQIDFLRHRFDARYHFVNLHPNLQSAARRDLEDCDIVLAQTIADWENYPLRSAIREGVPIVRFPLLRFASLWPFDHYNGPGDREAYQREWPNLTFTYLDGLLGQLREDIPDPAARFEAYRSLSVPGLVNYRRIHELEARRLTAMDTEFETDMGRYILENFQKRRLFYTTNHPNGELMAQLMRLILKRMGSDASGILPATLDMLSVDQVPIHPKIAADLGVRWVKPATRYLFRGEMVKWDTYVRRYIAHYG